MNKLVYIVFLFTLALIIHFIIWRLSLPKKNHTVSLLEIFFGVLIAGIFLSRIYSSVSFLGVSLPQGLSEYLLISFSYTALTLAYIVSYSAIEVDSPSLLMVLYISQSASRGLSKEKIEKIMTDDFLVKPRIDDLVKDKMLFFDKGLYKIASKGALLANIFIFYRKLLNAPKGG